MYRNSDPIPTFVFTANERAKLSFETDSFSLLWWWLLIVELERQDSLTLFTFQYSETRDHTHTVLLK